MTDADLSRFVSWLLRHAPRGTGVELAPGGWADVADVAEAARRRGRSVDADRIRALVHHQTKPRFTLSEEGARIRANYGHSVDVDLDLEAVRPPDVLLHGTAEGALESILESGLEPRGRTWVHLSDAWDDAVEVGARHGHPVVLEVRAAEMVDAGYVFFRAAPGFWLVESVPPEFLNRVEDGPEEG